MSIVPEWAADAVFYQIFPERFGNGDASNDPTRSTLEYDSRVPESWAVSPWTGDWYARADWEKAIGDNFYDDGVFHRRYGGDLQGVIDRLDYLDSLGVNCLYFNPIFYARSLHKYDGNSFHHIDPQFGPDPAGDFAIMAQETADPETWQWTAADKLFLDLVAGAHERDIRVIIDGVWNHTGRDFFAFADLREKQQESDYKEWYIVESFDDPDTEANEFRYKGWWGVESLPEFADTPDGADLHPGPKAYVMSATSRWMDPDGDGDPADGVDGWRLDVANEVPIAFWSEWNAHVRSLNPEAYTVSEIWDDASTFLDKGGFSATMNYHGFAFPVKGFLIDRGLSSSEFVEMLGERRGEYSIERQLALQNLIDSHDTDRLASMIVNRSNEWDRPDRFDYDHNVGPRNHLPYDIRKPAQADLRIQRLVALFQMTYVGAPMIYYGTEAGMWGADDPDDRMPMVWPEKSYDMQRTHPFGQPRQPDVVEFDHDLFSYYRSLIGVRRQTRSLRRGGIEIVSADDQSGALAFSRGQGEGAVIVAINRGDEEAVVTLDRKMMPAGTAIPNEVVFESVQGTTTIENGGERVTVRLQGVTGAILGGSRED